MPSYKYCCTLANFRIEKKIGRGQFSEVYKATYLLEGQLVALKKVQVQYSGVCLILPQDYSEHPDHTDELVKIFSTVFVVLSIGQLSIIKILQDFLK